MSNTIYPRISDHPCGMYREQTNQRRQFSLHYITTDEF